MESSALAWSLIPSDTEGLILLRRGYATQQIGSEMTGNSDDRNNDIVDGEEGREEPFMKPISDLYLPRIPTFHGGMVIITYSNGAVMRDGLEIDTSEVLCSVPANTTLYAIEQRLNSSNVWRLRVIYGGHYGWISERMRGGSEEFMVRRLRDCSQAAVDDALNYVIDSANALEITDRIRWDDQPSIFAAMQKWDEMVTHIGREEILGYGRKREESFEQFCDLVETLDGGTVWTTEADMQLAEFISQCAVKEGSTPQNVSSDRLIHALRSAGSVSSVNNVSSSMTGGDLSLFIPSYAPTLLSGSLISKAHVERVIARASLLRVANQILTYSLPYISTSLPEEQQRKDFQGSDDQIDLIPTSLPPPPSRRNDVSTSSSQTPLTTLRSSISPQLPLLAPPCTARRLRALRRLLFRLFYRLAVLLYL
jgi:hypothetical protein